MAGLQVRNAELRVAVQAGQAAAELIGALTPGEDLNAGMAGIPGAPVVVSVGQVAYRWQTAIIAWRSRTEGYAASLTAATSSYEQGDEAAAGRLSRAARPL